MLKDPNLSRRNLDKHPDDSNDENLDPAQAQPETPLPHLDTGDNRPPLSSIQEQDPSARRNSTKHAAEKTPSKGVPRTRGYGSLLRTPDKAALAVSGKNRFGWASAGAAARNDATAVAESGSASATVTSVGKDPASAFPASSHLPPPGRPLPGYNLGGFLTPRTHHTSRPLPTAGAPSSSAHSETGGSAHSTPNRSVNKPGYYYPTSCSRPSSASRAAANYTALSKGVPMSTPTIPTVVNSVDVPHFALKEDPSFWMDHNVQVVIRVRPLNGAERGVHGYGRCVKQESAQCITWIGQPEARFTFDHVACEGIDQDTLFRVTGLPMVENCISGYNSCVFAYGQTGSGKTYTMLGEIDELEMRPSLERGMTPRIFEFLFARIRAEEESRRDENLKYSCRCSFLEIYNEQITDLLDPSSTNLQIREDVQKGVYVENLTELAVDNVVDVLRLLVQGAANRRVAATNMNRESSRSHSVFTCAIESRWEKDSLANMRFARLNLVDLAGSERQKTSGAEGERLKEAANINKSLSTLGHVIMLLVDVAQGKHRHVPYRDSRLTFLLQDSLGGNSKTMIIANVSPSVCCANETLSTLKFAQRAKLIHNNAMINEDALGDVISLRHQIRVLKEELSMLKRQNVSRSLTFRSAIFKDRDEEQICAPIGMSLADEDSSDIRVSHKQMKSLEAVLTGALRRERTADITIKQLEAEIEQLNRLVHQREEDARCAKMIFKFREDKIQKMESVLSGLIPPSSYLLEEKESLAEEVKLLQAKLDRNPEVTRFALENIRLVDQLRRFQEFYGEGERDLLLAEVSELRNQLLQFLDKQPRLDNLLSRDSGNHMEPALGIPKEESDHVHVELTETREELENCRNNLRTCLEINDKLTREIDSLRSELNSLKNACNNQSSDEGVEDMEICSASSPSSSKCLEENVEPRVVTAEDSEEILNLHLEIDVLKTILGEERLSRCSTEDKLVLISNSYKDTVAELKTARLLIQELESQQIFAINEVNSLKKSCDTKIRLLREKDMEISLLNKQIEFHTGKEEKGPSQTIHSENSSPLLMKLKKMQVSLDKARLLNMKAQSDDQAYQSNELEKDEVRQQVEQETAEVILCLQEELSNLQSHADIITKSELEAREKILAMESHIETLHGRLYMLSQENVQLTEVLREKSEQLSSYVEEHEELAHDIARILNDGNMALEDAADQIDLIAGSFPKKSRISEQVNRMVRNLSEKDELIEELYNCLEEVQNARLDMEWKLSSLRGATLAISEAQRQENCEKEKEILLLTSQLSEKKAVLSGLENDIKESEAQVKRAELHATVASITVKRLSEINSLYFKQLEEKEYQINELMGLNVQMNGTLKDLTSLYAKSEDTIDSLKLHLEEYENNLLDLQSKLAQGEKQNRALKCELDKVKGDFSLSNYEDDISETAERLQEFNLGIRTLHSCINSYSGLPDVAPAEYDLENHVNGNLKNDSEDRADRQMVEQTSEELKNLNGNANDSMESLNSISWDSCLHREKCCAKVAECLSVSKDGNNRDAVLLLLRKEIECALSNLKGVQAQMSKLIIEKEQIQSYELQRRKEIDILATHAIKMEKQMADKEKQIKDKCSELGGKMQILESKAKDAFKCCNQAKLDFAIKVRETDMVATQKAFEASILFGQFEKAQETVKEADVMVNALMSSNESAKLEIQKYRKKESSLTSERDYLLGALWDARSSLGSIQQEYDTLQENVFSNKFKLENSIASLEEIFGQMQISSAKELNLLSHEIHNLRSQLLCSSATKRRWLEDIWSEIISKECSMSVLHHCNVGVLLEKLTELNAADSLLRCEIDDSSNVMASLVEQNNKANEELEMCFFLKGKFLADINNANKRITDKAQTGCEIIEVKSLNEETLGSRPFEESLLVRSNAMSQELATLIREFGVYEERSWMEFMSKDITISAMLNELKLRYQKIGVLKNRIDGMDKEISMQNSELMESTENNARFSLQIQLLQNEKAMFLTKLHENEAALVSTEAINDQNRQLQDELKSLHITMNQLQEEFDSRIAEINIVKSNSSDISKSLQLERAEVVHLQNILDSLHGENTTLKNEICSLKSEYSAIIENLQENQNSLRSESEYLKSELDSISKQKEESASIAEGRKGETEKLKAQVESLKAELAEKYTLHNESDSKCQKFEALLMEKCKQITALELKLAQEHESLEYISGEYSELKTQIEDVLEMKKSIEAELENKTRYIELLEEEVHETRTCLDRQQHLEKLLQDDFTKLTEEKEHFYAEVLILKEEIEMTHSIASEKEAIATEAQQIAEAEKTYAKDKEEEVKLLEKSIEELEYTINVLQNKVEIVKDDAERQRLQREELEMELLEVRYQLQGVETCSVEQYAHGGNATTLRALENQESELNEAKRKIEILKKSVADQESEIAQYKTHISELNTHAEAQAQQNMQKIKELEAMVQQVKECSSASSTSSTAAAGRAEKTAVKSRGSGSPFKCIGLGLTHQISMEKDEELAAARLQIQELEALITNQRKEIFTLNTKLASSESMTHDVIRDLLGVKLDITNYASLVDEQKEDKIMECTLSHGGESGVMGEEVVKLKEQLHEFIEERQGWLDEINRRQAEMVSTKITLEKLRQQEQFLSTENEMLKMDNTKHKKMVVQLEEQVEQLANQLNLQPRINHHVKIKEENDALKAQKKELAKRLHKADELLSRVTEELAFYRELGGKEPYIDMDEEEKLRVQLQDTEKQRIQLAQKLIGLCTSVMKVAGITNPSPDAANGASAAEEALKGLMDHIRSTESELHELKLKNKIQKEQKKLFELRQNNQLPSLRSRESEGFLR